jgi:hypothetical protein
MGFCVLNLSDSQRQLGLDSDWAGKSAKTIRSPEDIPTHRKDHRLVLYILGHAIPDALIGPNGETLTEQSLAAAIRRRRRRAPTLIVWDVCYAGSFKQTANIATWPRNYVHIFSCQKFERTWLQTPSEPNTTVATSFSKVLFAALDATQRHGDWPSLQAELQRLYGALQTPEVFAPSDREQRTAFAI